MTMTGMGEIVPIADAAGLAQGMIKVLQGSGQHTSSRATRSCGSSSWQRTVDEYETLFRGEAV